MKYKKTYTKLEGKNSTTVYASSVWCCVNISQMTASGRITFNSLPQRCLNANFYVSQEDIQKSICNHKISGIVKM